MPVWYIFGLAAELYSFLTMFVTGLPLCSHLEIKSLPDTKLLHQRDGCGLQQVNLQNMTNNLYTTPTNSSQPNTDICGVHIISSQVSRQKVCLVKGEFHKNTLTAKPNCFFYIYIYLYHIYAHRWIIGVVSNSSECCLQSHLHERGQHEQSFKIVSNRTLGIAVVLYSAAIQQSRLVG